MKESDLQKDAERYQWLRDHGFRFANVDLGTDCNGDNFVELKITFRIPELPNLPYEDEEWTGTEIDLAIDAAIAKGK